MTEVDPRPGEGVDALIAAMSLAEKAGQMAQVEKNSITPAQVAEFSIGSILSGGGGNPAPNTPETWTSMVTEYVDAALRSRLGIPLLYGVDAVHGHSNMVGATIFPHNIGLGASGDADLVERVYRATALETAATGVRWDFAPTVAVALDPRWGRTYESFGTDPELVARLGAAAVRGLQGQALDQPGSVLACTKHYVGDGGTTWGTARRYDWNDWWDGWGSEWSIDQGDTRVDEALLRAVHLRPYLESLQAGAMSVMASYNSWNGDKLHGHHYLLTEVLKIELGFRGFVVTDWMGIGQLDADPYACVVKSINAGIDMVMVPFDYRSFIDNLVRAVDAGDVSDERVDDAVRRILEVKDALGLFAQPASPPDALPEPGAQEHRDLAREAVASSAVLLANRTGTLPIDGAGTRILVAGEGADDVGLQCGGWTIEWLGAPGPITPGTTIVEALRAAEAGFDVVFEADARFAADARAPFGIVVAAERPYAEGVGDRADLGLADHDVDLVARVRSRVDRLVLVLLSGRPLLLDRVADQCDAIVAAWLPGTEGAGVADLLTGRRPFSAVLPRPWPADASQVADPGGRWDPAWRVGDGLTT